jgi:hypothetical protein
MVAISFRGSLRAMAEDGRNRGERLQIMLNEDEVLAVDDFRFKTRGCRAVLLP